jgi:hypothetical protein
MLLVGNKNLSLRLFKKRDGYENWRMSIVYEKYNDKSFVVRGSYVEERTTRISLSRKLQGNCIWNPRLRGGSGLLVPITPENEKALEDASKSLGGITSSEPEVLNLEEPDLLSSLKNDLKTSEPQPLPEIKSHVESRKIISSRDSRDRRDSRESRKSRDRRDSRDRRESRHKSQHRRYDSESEKSDSDRSESERSDSERSDSERSDIETERYHRRTPPRHKRYDSESESDRSDSDRSESSDSDSDSYYSRRYSGRKFSSRDSRDSSSSESDDSSEDERIQQTIRRRERGDDSDKQELDTSIDSDVEDVVSLSRRLRFVLRRLRELESKK